MLSFGALGHGRETVTPRPEVPLNQSKDGQEPLRLTSRLEPPQRPLALAHRLVRVLSALGQALSLAVFDPRQELPCGGSLVPSRRV